MLFVIVYIFHIKKLNSTLNNSYKPIFEKILFANFLNYSSLLSLCGSVKIEQRSINNLFIRLRVNKQLPIYIISQNYFPLE